MGNVQAFPRCSTCSFLIYSHGKEDLSYTTPGFDFNAPISGTATQAASASVMLVPTMPVPNAQLQYVTHKPMTGPKQQPRAPVSCCRRDVDKNFKLHERNHFAYDPPDEEDQRRWGWYQRRLAEKITLTRDVPWNVRYNIAQYLVRHMAAAMTTRQWTGKPAGTVASPLSKPIYTQHVKFEGAWYISALGHSPYYADQRPSWVPEQYGFIDALYIAENHLGIVHVSFGLSNEHLNSPFVKDTDFWRSIPLPSQLGHVLWRHDGVKIRSISVNDHYGRVQTGTPVITSIGRPMSRPLRHFKFGPALETQRMYPLLLNDPNITGYSVCFTGRTFSVYTHRCGVHDVAEWYEANVEAPFTRSIWQHIPMNEKEVVTELWQAPTGPAYHLSLTFLTNHGRKIRVGNHRKMASRQLDWQNLDVFQPEPSYIFHQTVTRSLANIALDGIRNRPSRGLCSIPVLSTPPHHTMVQPLEFYCTEASLDGLYEIYPCKRKIGTQNVIVGLMLTYLDGRRDAVGQVRLDWLGSPLQVGNICIAYVGFESSDKACVNPVHITVKQPRQSRSMNYFQLPLFGKFHWWFTFSSARIHHAIRPQKLHNDKLGSEQDALVSACHDLDLPEPETPIYMFPRLW
ncbi:hypothetical protein S40285_04310 [Stachybotrys chlorohalonatus IBT 40285]|uniref:Uncharacterized protein n=1 Tax=Stachybotrys chlorohalonatus (strain IBT 40285) TaxID=1283841 RepID=A0A084QQ78_STAC4|nr:hypothetical protein S40285_04310 [Stachybotrys chlorohalonata IBT 40285]